MKLARSLVLILCVALLLACANVPGINQPTATPTLSSVFATLTAHPIPLTPITQVVSVQPPSVAAFCPSSQTLAPIVGETMKPDFTTGTHGLSTTCGYISASGNDTAEFTITAFADAHSAKSDYTKVMNAATQVGAQIHPLSGLGDAAYYFAGEAIFVLKGSFDFLVKFYYLQSGTNEQVDLQIARLLVSKI